MLYPTRLLLLAWLTVALTACGDAPAPPTPVDPNRKPDPEAGRQVARLRCSGCHAVDGQGGRLGPALPDAIRGAATKAAAHPDRGRALPADHAALHRAALDRVAAAPAGDARLRAWLTAYIAAPRFDDPAAKMAPIRLRDEQLHPLLDYLLTLD